MYTTCPHCGAVTGTVNVTNNNVAAGNYGQTLHLAFSAENTLPLTAIQPLNNVACAVNNYQYLNNKTYIFTLQADGSMKQEEKL